MKMEKLWEKYKTAGAFNMQALPESLIKQGVLIEYEKNSILVSRGEQARLHILYRGRHVGRHPGVYEWQYI